MKYSQMLKKVEQIATEVKDPNIDLDDLISKIETGYDLIKQMKTRLETASDQVEKLRLDFEAELESGAENLSDPAH
jgi:exodeoxyribonuclease VII small subunit